MSQTTPCNSKLLMRRKPCAVMTTNFIRFVMPLSVILLGLLNHWKVLESSINETSYGDDFPPFLTHTVIKAEWSVEKPLLRKATNKIATDSLEWSTQNMPALTNATDHKAMLNSSEGSSKVHLLNTTDQTTIHRLERSKDEHAPIVIDNTGLYSSGSPEPSSAYAYCFLLARCNPDQPYYRGFLWSVLVAMRQLRSSGSIADFVVLIHMSSNSSSSFPLEEEAYIYNLGGRIRFLPASDLLGTDTDSKNTKKKTAGLEGETFDDVQLLKFHILESTEYRRVMFLDADVFPLCNLDYIFRLSDLDHYNRELSAKVESGLTDRSHSDPYTWAKREGELRIQENFVVAWSKEPSNGGFFMLRPGPNDFEELKGIVSRQRETLKKSRGRFDPVKGWGHTLVGTEDTWASLRKRRKRWNFYAAQSDQGLLYYWVKYAKQSVTINTNLTSLEHWGRGNDTDPILIEERHDGPLQQYSCLHQHYRRDGKGTVNGRMCTGGFTSHPSYGNNFCKQTPYGDYVHFYSASKPWLWNSTSSELKPIYSMREAKSAVQFWFHVLREINYGLSMGLNLDDWDQIQRDMLQEPLPDDRVEQLF